VIGVLPFVGFLLSLFTYAAAVLPAGRLVIWCWPWRYAQSRDGPSRRLTQCALPIGAFSIRWVITVHTPLLGVRPASDKAWTLLAGGPCSSDFLAGRCFS